MVRIESGESVLRPSEVGTAARETFQVTVSLLLQLRTQGWIRLPDGRIARDRDGQAILIGPCDLTEAGGRALEADRRLGPRA